MFQTDAQTTRLGKIWFCCAGLFALAIVCLIVKTDISLTYSNGEEIKGRNLREIRSAQSSLGVARIDERTLVGVKPFGTTVVAEKESHSENHAENHSAH